MPIKEVPSYQSFLFHLHTAGTRLLSLAVCRSITGTQHIPDGPCIFAPNHLSLLDGPLVVNELNRVLHAPIHMMSIKEPFDHPTVGPLMRLSGCVPYDRNNPAGGREALSVLLGFLHEGQKVALFPEGHLGHRQRIRRCRMGMAILAMESGAPVIPIGIVGTDEIHMPGKGWKRFDKRARITIGPAIAPAPWQQKYQEGDTPQRREVLRDFTRHVMQHVGILSGQEVLW